MSKLIAIGYDDTTTALDALDAAEEMAKDLVIQPDALAAIIRNEDGRFRTVTNQHAVGAGTTWGMFWGLLFGMLFFVPIFGMAMGAAFGALGGKLADDSIGKDFQDQVRSALEPGTSALFMLAEEAIAIEAIDRLSDFGGTVVTTTLSAEDEAALQAHLHGAVN
jgi:uncharacterized membrane protein